jgi:hypothetical protein
VRRTDSSDFACRKATRAALGGLVLLSGLLLLGMLLLVACLNPRPEELPSNASAVEPGAAESGIDPNAAGAPVDREPSPQDSTADLPSAPESSGPAFAPSEPSDAGAPDAGAPAANDAGSGGD